MGLQKLRFVGSDVGKDVVADVVDLHFIEGIDGVAIGGVSGGFEDDLEPGGVGAAFLVEKDSADAVEVGG